MADVACQPSRQILPLLNEVFQNGDAHHRRNRRSLTTRTLSAISLRSAACIYTAKLSIKLLTTKAGRRGAARDIATYASVDNDIHSRRLCHFITLVERC